MCCQIKTSLSDVYSVFLDLSDCFGPCFCQNEVEGQNSKLKTFSLSKILIKAKVQSKF